MDTLRVSLLIVGILIVVGIYLFGRRQLDAEDRRIKLVSPVSWSRLFSRLAVLFSGISLPKVKLPKWERSQDEDLPGMNSEALTDDDLEEVGSIVADRKEILSDADDVSMIVELTSEQIAPGGEQLFIPVTIVGRHGHNFTGEGIQYAMHECGFVRDDSGIFYHEVEDQQGFQQRLLGLANIMEPGTFAEEHLMGTFATPGLVLYLHLPAPIEAREAFSILIEKGRSLATVLEGDLCDETRSVLTNQTIGHLKEKVEAYRFKQKMTQIKHHRK